MQTAITPTRKDNYPQWYQEVIIAADLAQLSPVRGCMIINPWGYAIWEKIQRNLDDEIKARDHENIYCPLLMPLSHIERESEHIDGFAKECAVVTHSKLKKNDDGNLVPASPLEEPLIIRPTSEMIIGDVFAQRIQSHRDLPVLLNQWANIMRWEMRTRMFLRTSEFLWQEGHTAHANANEAQQHSQEMLQCYYTFCKDYLAIPVVTGEKSKNEKFPGAEITYTIEAIMQDKKALQMGTSHYLGQTFSKSCQIQFQDANKKLQYAYTTSWGVTTRLIGGLIMTHADDDGLICPPNIAPYQVVIIPIYKKDQPSDQLLSYCKKIQKSVQSKSFKHAKIRVKVDMKNKKHGEKKWSWVKKGVPIRIEVGQKELENQSVCLSLRIEDTRTKHQLSEAELLNEVESLLNKTHDELYQRASARLEDGACPLLESSEAVREHFCTENPSPALIYWCDNDKIEQQLQDDYKVSIRCYPDAHIFPHPTESKSLFDGQKKGRLALIAKAY